MALRTSLRGIRAIKRHELFVPVPYYCQAKVLTIGYGHTKNVKEGMKITEKKAEELLRADLKHFENVVNTNVRVELKQHEFDALVSLVYNIGGGAFERSTLLKRINRREDKKYITREWFEWCNVKGETSIILLRRRAEEISYYLGGRLQR